MEERKGGKACELGVGDRVEVTWSGSRLRSEENSSGRQKETDLRGEAGSKPKDGDECLRQ